MPMSLSRLFAALLPGAFVAVTFAQNGTAHTDASPAQQQKIQPVPIKNVLYGAAYYHEYEPYERLDKDVAMMKDAGLTVVRLGESTWSLWEPEEGKFEYAWMDRVVDAMGKAGIKEIMGTPTSTVGRTAPHGITRPVQVTSWSGHAGGR